MKIVKIKIRGGYRIPGVNTGDILNAVIQDGSFAYVEKMEGEGMYYLAGDDFEVMPEKITDGVEKLIPGKIYVSEYPEQKTPTLCSIADGNPKKMTIEW